MLDCDGIFGDTLWSLLIVVGWAGHWDFLVGLSDLGGCGDAEDWSCQMILENVLVECRALCVSVLRFAESDWQKKNDI